ncbi:MAG TPA: hypothetical protein VFK94_06625 [Patescibacteria group bacterium]|nr:hypothetical protein [Patescibacteria group bacterium]
MSHFAVLVLVDHETPKENLEAEVARLLAPYDENGEWFRPEGGGKPESKWDWWVIGGRWSGALGGNDPKYDPAMNPINYSRCRYCDGSGTRSDMNPRPDWSRQADPLHPVIGEGCNVCHGTGWEFRFGDWVVPEDGNIRRLKDVPETFDPFALVTPNGEWHERGRMGWFGVAHDEKSMVEWRKNWAEQVRNLHPDTWAVIVDCHV